MLFQAEREEPLGARERLLPDVIAGHEAQVRLCDFDVVTEDLVIADLQRAYAGPLPLSLLKLREEAPPARQPVAQLVEVRGKSRPDDPAPLEIRRRPVRDCALYVIDQIRARLKRRDE